MIIDNITIALSCATLIVAALTSVLANPFSRKFAEHGEDGTDVAHNDGASEDGATDGAAPADAQQQDRRQQVSVLLIADGTAEQMDSHLPTFLTQHYEPGFEVVVVATQGDSATEDVLKRYASHPGLYATFAPATSLFMSHAKLAVTIGMKAAHHEWVIVTSSRYTPISDEWIAGMVASCSHDTNAVVGYTLYADGTPPYRQYERMRELTYLLRRALHGKALATRGANVMVRKSLFMQADGYRGNLEFIQGEYDFLANKYGADGTSAAATSHEAWLMEDTPSAMAWRNEHVSFINYRHALTGIASHRALHIVDTLCLHATYIAIAAMAAFAAVMQMLVLTGAAVAALLLTIGLRTWLACRAARRLGTRLAVWQAPLYELRGLWSGMGNKLAYMRADKHEFTSHKL